MNTKRMTNAELSAFCLELHEIWHAGLPLSEGLLSLCDSEDGRDSRPWMEKLCRAADEGLPFSAALAQAGEFPKYMVDMLALSDRTGRQEEALCALSEYYDRSDRITHSVRSAVLYPAMLSVVMLIVIAVLLTKVLPIFSGVFEQLGANMSGIAVRLMHIGQALSGASAAIGAAIAAFAILALFAWFLPPLHARAGRLVSGLFGGRGVWRRIASAKFASAMAMATQSGLPIQEAVRAAAGVCGGDVHTDRKTAHCIELLEKGEHVADALRVSGMLPTRTCRMIGLGERTGSQADIFAEVARRSEQAVDDELGRMIGWIEPILVIVTATVVGVVLLSVMLPLLGILSSIG
ncbi:MAG: type II secretion system F family protein [Intestinibacillus sp.]